MSNETKAGYILLAIAISLMLTNRHSYGIVFNVAAMTLFIIDIIKKHKK